jgi:pimeloyl-ACP methyl ester carboxylesterase
MAAYRSQVRFSSSSEPASVDPPGFVVLVEPGDRVHFQDWGGSGIPGVVLIHGLAATSWTWAPVARRLVGVRRTVAFDLRGHGLSDAPTEPGAYELDALGADAIAVCEGSALLVERTDQVVLVGHGFGAIVAAVAAARLGSRCDRLVLVDGGLDDIGATSGMDADEFLRGLDEPPEVMASMAAYLADRRGWDPPSWDADQDRAARAAVVETPAGRLVGSTRPHALEATVRSMFGYQPDRILPRVSAPIVAIRRVTPGDESAAAAGSAPPHGAAVVDVPAPGHNLPRYRPDEVTAAILGR